MKILALIIVYNKRISDSLTFNNLKKIQQSFPSLDIVVFDNSTKDYKNKEYSLSHDIKYISKKSNIGLSKAYNIVLDTLSSEYNDNDLIVFLDDDTKVNKDYFIQLCKAARSKSKIDIFAPIIRGQDGVIYSPNNANFLKNHLLKDVKNIREIKNFNAISSCLAVRFRVFKKYRFDERLFLDEVDQKFCEDQRKLGRKFSLIYVVICQNFHQRDSQLDANTLWPRFKLRIRDIIVYGKLKGNQYLYIGFLKTNLLGIQYALKTKDSSLMAKTFKLSKYWMKEDIK